ncbi:MAG: ABC transporter permease subunit [Bacteroidota bacterium]
MLWTIVKRELVDHITSLRFSAIFALAVLLMIVSVLVFSVTYKTAVKEYPLRVEQLVNEDGTVNLGMVACTGGATVRRLPLPLAFCSETGESELPNQVVLAVHGLRSIQRTAEIGAIFSGSAHVDWAFVIAALLSFGAGLLTYKSISAELRDGTLTLLLSNPISRNAVLLGKYLAALIAVAAAFSVAILLSLIALQSLDVVQFTGDDWLKIGLFWILSIGYLSIFILIGLLCSVLTREPLLSAVAFLFVWTSLVFIIPNLGGILASQLCNAKTPLQMRETANAIPDQFTLTAAMRADEVASVKLQRELARERLLMEYLQSLIRQVHLGQDLTRISPASTFSYAAEELVGGGTFRLQNFVNNAVRFREGFFEAIREADRQDPDSQHRYVPWWCGSSAKHFSQRVVDLGPAKEFRDAPPSSSEGLAAAFWDIFLLVLYNVFAFAVAFWRFARQDVAPTPGVLRAQKKGAKEVLGLRLQAVGLG